MTTTRLPPKETLSWQKYNPFLGDTVRFLSVTWVLIGLVAIPETVWGLSPSAQETDKTPVVQKSDTLRWSFGSGAVLQTEAGTRLLGIHLGISPGLTVSSIKEPDARHTSIGLSLARQRLRLAGQPIPLRLAYNMSLSLDRGVLSFKDVWIDAALGTPACWLRAGNLRRVFSRQMLIPYHRMALPDRPLTEQVFQSGHDPGVMLHAGPWGAFEWAVAFLMGDYESPVEVGKRLRRETPVAQPPASAEAGSVLVRLARRPMQGPMLSESDTKKLPFRWSVGMSIQALMTTEEVSRGALQAEVDLHISARGWTLMGAFFVATEQEDTRLENQAFQAAGYTLQSSYLVGETFEPSVRFTHLIFPGASTDVKDISTGFSLSFYGGMLRWINRLGMVRRDIEGGYRSDVAFKSHLQFWY